MTTDVNTLRRTLECLTHFGIATAYVRVNGVMVVYGYTDYAAVYCTVPAEGRGTCALSVAHLVKVLHTCMPHSLIRLAFGEHLRVINEVEYTVSYVDRPLPELSYPTVRSCSRYSVNIATLNRFLKLVGDTVSVDQGLTLRASYESVIASSVTFPPFEHPLLSFFNVPLACDERWDGPMDYSSTLLKYLCRTQSFQSSGVLVLCRGHLVYMASRGEVTVQICFTPV